MGIVRQIRELLGTNQALGAAGLFSSQIMLNLSFFVILLVASITLDSEEFAKLSLGMGWVNVLANVFSFGIDQAALKLGFERKNSGFVATNVYLKGALLCGVFSAILIGTSTLVIRTDIAVVCAAAAGVAFWTSARTIELFQKNFGRLAVLNLVLASSRILAGGLAIFSHSSTVVLIAIHLVAQLPIHLFTLMHTLRALCTQAQPRLLLPMFKVAPIMFASSVLFTALPVLTQQTMFNNGDTAAASAFGAVLIFVAPLYVVSSTLRAYLLPKILDPAAKPSLGKAYFLPLLMLWAVLGLGTAFVVSFIIPFVYGSRLPLVQPFAAVYLSAFILIGVLGLMNLSSQRGSLIIVDLAVNIARFVAVWLACLLIKDPSKLVNFTAFTLLAGELTLRGILFVHERRGNCGKIKGELELQQNS